MANEKEVDVIGTLSTAIGEQLEKQRKNAQPIPDVYSSGMRGKEKPPHLREKKEKKTDPNAGEERFTQDGKRVVTFKAKPQAKTADRIATLEKRIEELTKKLEGKPAAQPDKKKKTVAIA